MVSGRDAGPADVAALAERIRRREPAAVARGITWCEQGGARAGSLLAALDVPAPATPHVVGLTGPPGAGKSTLVNALVGRARAAGVAVGVVAVDPTSPISGGALLGDRIRLDDVPPGDRGVFFRSLASRGAPGGMADAAAGATRVLGAAGYELVIVETVGAGQGEVSVMTVADTVCVVLIPGAGDDLQAMKAGLMEIADVFVLNKADRPGIDDLATQVSGMLALRATVHGHDGWVPPVVRTVARDGGGIDELWDALSRHRAVLAAEPEQTAARRRLRAAVEARRAAEALFARALAAVTAEGAAGGGEGAPPDGGSLARAAARRLLAQPADRGEDATGSRAG
jgi:LAO/AO transport system kinase